MIKLFKKPFKSMLHKILNKEEKNSIMHEVLSVLKYKLWVYLLSYKF